LKPRPWSKEKCYVYGSEDLEKTELRAPMPATTRKQKGNKILYGSQLCTTVNESIIRKFGQAPKEKGICVSVVD